MAIYNTRAINNAAVPTERKGRGENGFRWNREKRQMERSVYTHIRTIDIR